MDSIFHRTSIRKYQDREVEQGKIRECLRAAMAAPSACNQQPWEYYVVTERGKLEELAASSPYAGCVKEAPLAFVACYRTECIAPEYAQIDLSASVENLLLEADSQGLGAVWLGIAPHQERMDLAGKALGLPDSLKIFAIIPCGYSAEERTQEDRYQEERIHFV